MYHLTLTCIPGKESEWRVQNAVKKTLNCSEFVFISSFSSLIQNHNSFRDSFMLISTMLPQKNSAPKRHKIGLQVSVVLISSGGYNKTHYVYTTLNHINS